MTMNMMRIEPPAWAPAHAQHVIKWRDSTGERGRELALRHLPEIWAELDRRIADFANDPERCFLYEGFPLRERLAGTYYIGSETYEGPEEGEPCQYTLWLFIRCLETEWHPNQKDVDYLGLEAIVYLEPDGSGFTFDEGLAASVI